MERKNQGIIFVADASRTVRPKPHEASLQQFSQGRCYNDWANMKITPELLVDNLSKSLDFYQTYLDFSVITSFPENQPFFALLQKDQSQIMLYARPQFEEEIRDFSTQPTGGTFVLYIDVPEINNYYQKMVELKNIVQPLHETTYGTIEFTGHDPDGYKLMFAQKIANTQT